MLYNENIWAWPCAVLDAFFTSQDILVVWQAGAPDSFSFFLLPILLRFSVKVEICTSKIENQASKLNLGY